MIVHNASILEATLVEKVIHGLAVDEPLLAPMLLAGRVDTIVRVAVAAHCAREAAPGHRKAGLTLFPRCNFHKWTKSFLHNIGPPHLLHQVVSCGRVAGSQLSAFSKLKGQI